MFFFFVLFYTIQIFYKNTRSIANATVLHTSSSRRQTYFAVNNVNFGDVSLSDNLEAHTF